MAENYLGLFLGFWLDISLLLVTLHRSALTTAWTLIRTWPCTFITTSDDPTCIRWPRSAATCRAATIFHRTARPRFTPRRGTSLACSVTTIRAWPSSTFVIGLAPTTTSSSRRSATSAWRPGPTTGVSPSFTASRSRPSIAAEAAGVRTDPTPRRLLITSVTRPRPPPVVQSTTSMVAYNRPRITQSMWRLRWPLSTFISHGFLSTSLLITVTTTIRRWPFPGLLRRWTLIFRSLNLLSCWLWWACGFTVR